MCRTCPGITIKRSARFFCPAKLCDCCLYTFLSHSCIYIESLPFTRISKSRNNLFIMHLPLPFPNWQGNLCISTNGLQYTSVFFFLQLYNLLHSRILGIIARKKIYTFFWIFFKIYFWIYFSHGYFNDLFPIKCRGENLFLWDFTEFRLKKVR